MRLGDKRTVQRPPNLATKRIDLAHTHFCGFIITTRGIVGFTTLPIARTAGICRFRAYRCPRIRATIRIGIAHALTDQNRVTARVFVGNTAKPLACTAVCGTCGAVFAHLALPIAANPSTHTGEAIGTVVTLAILRA